MKYKNLMDNEAVGELTNKIALKYDYWSESATKVGAHGRYGAPNSSHCTASHTNIREPTDVTRCTELKAQKTPTFTSQTLEFSKRVFRR